MEFLANNCIVFLVIGIIAAIIAFANQVSRIIRMGKSMDNGNVEDSFFKGIVTFAIFAFVSSISLLLSVIGIAIKILS